MTTLDDKVYGCLAGGLIGDAMGAPVEGKTYQQIQELFGPAGIDDFEGTGTDDTAIREQLLQAIHAGNGYPTVDDFAQTFIDSRRTNYDLWSFPVRNSFHKYVGGMTLPAHTGWGTQQSSSTAMAFSPVGIINACRPRQAALEALHLGAFIHNGPSGFCRDAAAAMSAAVAEAFNQPATIDDVLAAATRYLPPVSAAEMCGLIESALRRARETGSYEAFRAQYYETSLHAVTSDSRETVPAALAILQLAEGAPRESIIWAVNFGRDADTIATMVGGVVGALHGARGLPPEWLAKLEANPEIRYRDATDRLVAVIERRAQDLAVAHQRLAALR